MLAEIERICLTRLDVLRTEAPRVEWAGVLSGEEREEELVLLALPLPLEENKKEKGEEEGSFSSLDTFGCSLRRRWMLKVSEEFQHGKDGCFSCSFSSVHRNARRYCCTSCCHTAWWVV